MTGKKILVGFVLLCGVMPVRANIALKDSLMNLNEVVVTATRTPKLLKDVPLVTRVITAEDIRKSDATNIEDLLKTVLPGVEFSFSMDQQTDLNFSGFGGNSVLFLVDGERMAGETLDNIDYNRLTLDNVERVEIVKGAASSLYGSNAVGAVINIITKKPDNGLTFNLNGRLGAYNDQRYGGSVGYGKKNFTTLTNVQYTKIDDINLDRAGDFNKVYGKKTWNFKENLTYQPFSKLDLTGNMGYFFRERMYSADTHNRYRDLDAGLKGNYKFSQMSNLELSYFFDQYDKSDLSMLTNKDVRDYSNVQHSVRTLYNYTFSNIGTLTVGGDLMRDYLMSYQFTNDGSHKQYTVDGFAQFDWNITHHLNLLGGMRYDYFSEASMDHLSTKLALMYKFPFLRLRASYAGGFRAPSLKEMYMNFDMASIFTIYGNKDLKPETNNNFQLSAEYTKGNYSLTATGYYSAFKNRITTAWNQELKGMEYINMAKMNLASVELNAEAKYACGIGASLSYVYTDEHVKSGQPLTRSTRPHTGVVRVEYDHSWKNYGFNFAINGRLLSSLRTDEYTSTTSYEQTERVKYPGYQLWKATFIQRIYKGVRLTMAVDNLFNYRPKYYYSNSPATRGTTFSCGVSLDLDKLIKL
ncbi:MAG: TonB-dependent receptor [Prevotella sp.]|jgi:outer membrane receptor for ferrienterochelin and colicins|nr:TonB-dependent receptor [Prevotella sp.]MCH3995587.1 TonB-dependent receptor [Prevotella sp.]MCI1246238.1 TonB-dependent receptor [Prevotella sp.]